MYLFLFLCFSTSSLTVPSGRPKCISVFVPRSSSKWQRRSPLPIHKGIVDPGRVCWDGRGPEGLAATLLPLTLCVVPWRKGCADLPMPALLPPALPGLAAPGLHPVLMSEAQREENKTPQCSKTLLSQYWSEAYVVWWKSSSTSVEEVGAGSSPFLAWTVTCN